MNLTLTPNTRALVPIAMLLAPLGAALFVDLFDGVGPRTSAAAPAGAVLPPMLPVNMTPALSQTDASALRWADEQRARLERLSSPMYQQAAAPTITPTEPAPLVVQPDNSPRVEIPSFRLTGLLTSQNTRWAAINHNLYREGDQVESGWTLQTIDGAARRVLVRHTSGATIELFAD